MKGIHMVGKILDTQEALSTRLEDPVPGDRHERDPQGALCEGVGLL